MSTPTFPARAELVIDRAALRHNVRLLKQHAPSAAMMVVVKADGYGHGLAEAANAAREAGAEWIGCATIDEAVRVRDSGDQGRILCWLTVPGEAYVPAIVREIEVTAYSTDELAEIVRAAGECGLPARVQLKVDTGLSRGGAPEAEWDELFAAAAWAQDRGGIVVTGVWSHLACSDEPEHPANDAQEATFRDALARAHAAGLRPEVEHLANSAATLLRPSSHFSLVRCGIASYGLDPAPDVAHGVRLRPAMTARAQIALVKGIAAGSGVSYGHTYLTDTDTNVALVPVGYGDGVLRYASSRVSVWVAGKQRPLIGRVCMDQFVLDLGEDTVVPGEPAVLFGNGDHGEPTATDWAIACETINYEIVTRIGGRFTRRYVDSGFDRPDEVG